MRGGTDVVPGSPLLRARPAGHGRARRAPTPSADPVALRWTGLDPGDTTGRGVSRLRPGRRLEGVPRGRRPAALPRAEPRLRRRRRAHRLHGHGRHPRSARAPTGCCPSRAPARTTGPDTSPSRNCPASLDPPRGFIVDGEQPGRLGSLPLPVAVRLARALPGPTDRRKHPRRTAAWARRDVARSSSTASRSRPTTCCRCCSTRVPADAASARSARTARKPGIVHSRPTPSPPRSMPPGTPPSPQMPEDELKRPPPRQRSLAVPDRRAPLGLGMVRRHPDATKETCADFKSATLSRRPSRASPDGSGRRSFRLDGGSVSTSRRFPTASSTTCPSCAPFFSLEIGQGGDASTVNVGAYRRDGSSVMSDGPSYRQILDLADLLALPLRPHDRPVRQRLLHAVTGTFSRSGAMGPTSGWARPARPSEPFAGITLNDRPSEKGRARGPAAGGEQPASPCYLAEPVRASTARSFGRSSRDLAVAEGG